LNISRECWGFTYVSVIDRWKKPQRGGRKRMRRGLEGAKRGLWRLRSGLGVR